MTAALYLVAGFASGLLWAHRAAVLDALMAAVDWLTTDPPGPVAPARPCVRLVRGGERDAS